MPATRAGRGRCRRPGCVTLRSHGELGSRGPARAIPRPVHGLRLASVPSSVEEVAYDASIRSIERQYSALANLRTRAGTLLAAAALVASFLGAQAIRSNAGSLSSGWVALGIAALVAVLGLVLAILWPHPFTFRLSATVILEDHAGTDSRTEVPDLLSFLAKCQEGHHKKNEDVLDRLMLRLRLASVAVVVETVALLLAV